MVPRIIWPQVRYPVQEKEFLAVVQALHTWRSLLMLRPFIVRSDYYSLQYVQQQKGINNSRLARWLDFLSQFEFSIEYFPGTKNNAADALSRHVSSYDGSVSIGVEELDSPTSVVTINKNLKNEITEAYDSYKYCQPLVESLRDGKEIDKSIQFYIKHFKWVDGLLYYDVFTTGTFARIVIPSKPMLRQKLISIAHDSPTAGHFGAMQTYDTLSKTWCWPNMIKSIKHYVNTCFVCQTSKRTNQLTQGLFAPLDTNRQMDYNHHGFHFGITNYKFGLRYDSSYR